MKLLLTMGRPLWSSLQIDRALGVATTKLINGSDHSMESLLSYLLCRANMTISPISVLSRTLVRSHMASVDFIDSDARTLKISYRSEPIVAIAARGLFRNKAIRHMAFKAMKEYLQRQVLDRGRIVETVFEHILLFAIDDSDDSSLQYNLDNSRLDERGTSHLRSVMDCDSFLLSINFASSRNGTPMEVDVEMPLRSTDTERTGLNEPTVLQEIPVTEDIGAGTAASHITSAANSVSKEEYHVIQFCDFIKSYAGPVIFPLIQSYLPKESALIEGFMNSCQFLNLERDTGGDLASYFGSIEARPFRIERSLIKSGLIRQCAFVMPPNYPAIDFILPVLLKKPIGNRPIYGYVPFQSKASMGSGTFYSEIAAMEMSLHVRQCVCTGNLETDQHSPDCLTDEEYHLMLKEQVVFLMSLDKTSETIREENETLVFSKMLSADEINLAKARDSSRLVRTRSMRSRDFETVKARALDELKESFGALISDDVRWNNVRAYPEIEIGQNFELPDVIVKKLFGPVNGIPVPWSVIIMSWKASATLPSRTLTCFLSHDIMNFDHILPTGTLETIKEMINGGQPFFSDIPRFHHDLFVDSRVNGNFSGFIRYNNQVRASARESQIPDSKTDELSNFGAYNLSSSVNRCIRRNNGEGEPLP